jgi:glutamine synthetase
MTASCAASTWRATSSSGAGGRLRLLRRGAGLGFERPARTTTSTYTGWHTAYPDAPARILPETCREMPTEGNGMPAVPGRVRRTPGNGLPARTLRRVLDSAPRTWASRSRPRFEYEFFVFDETPHSVREKNYRNLKPITPGNLRLLGAAQLGPRRISTTSCSKLCEDMDMRLEGLHTETGPGVLEAAIMVDDAINAADKAVLFKTLHQGAGAEARLDGHLHVEMVARTGPASRAISTCR